MPSLRANKAMKKRSAVMKGNGAGKELHLSKTGQHSAIGHGCIASSLKGVACKLQRVLKSVPYCKACMAAGDPSLKVKQHPKYGNILVAGRRLPKGYKVAWWGAVKSGAQMTEKAMEWALEMPTKPKRYIDATPFKGSQLQFTSCAGPSEVTTINFASKNADALADTRASKSCLLFSTIRDIPEGHQVTMMYNLDEKTTDEFFQEQGITRADVGTAKYPALRKKSKGPAPWARGKSRKASPLVKGKRKARLP